MRSSFFPLLLLCVLLCAQAAAADVSEQQCEAPTGPELSAEQKARLDVWPAALKTLGGSVRGVLGSLDADLRSDAVWARTCSDMGVPDPADCEASVGDFEGRLWIAQALLAASGNPSALNWLQPASTRPQMRLAAMSLQVSLGLRELSWLLQQAGSWPEEEQIHVLNMAATLGADRGDIPAMTWAAQHEADGVRVPALLLLAAVGEPDLAAEWALLQSCEAYDCKAQLPKARGPWTYLRDDWSSLSVDARQYAMGWIRWTDDAWVWATAASSHWTALDVSTLVWHAGEQDKRELGRAILLGWLNALAIDGGDLTAGLPRAGQEDHPDALMELDPLESLLLRLRADMPGLKPILTRLTQHTSRNIALLAAVTATRLEWMDIATPAFDRLADADGSLPAWLFRVADSDTLLGLSAHLDRTFQSQESDRACTVLQTLAYARHAQDPQSMSRLLYQTTNDLLAEPPQEQLAIVIREANREFVGAAPDTAAMCRFFYLMNVHLEDPDTLEIIRKKLEVDSSPMAALLLGWILISTGWEGLDAVTERLIASGEPDLAELGQTWKGTN